MDIEKSTPVMVRLPPELLRRLDDWRRAEADLPGRAEAIRRMIEWAAEAKVS